MKIQDRINNAISDLESGITSDTILMSMVSDGVPPDKAMIIMSWAIKTIYPLFKKPDANV